MHEPGTHVGRFQLRELVEHIDDLQVFRAEDADTHEAVQLVLLTARPEMSHDDAQKRARMARPLGGTPAELTRARLADIATHAPLVEAGAADNCVYLAMPAGAADQLVADVIAALLPPITPDTLPPSTLWVRVRPFVAALLIVVLALIGLHVWDGIEARREMTAPRVVVPGALMGAGRGGLDLRIWEGTVERPM